MFAISIRNYNETWYNIFFVTPIINDTCSLM